MSDDTQIEVTGENEISVTTPTIIVEKFSREQLEQKISDIQSGIDSLEIERSRYQNLLTTLITTME